MDSNSDVEILKIGPFVAGNAVVVSGDWNDCRHATERIRKAQWPKDTCVGPDGNVFAVPLIVIGPASLEVADEERMNKAGWFRK
jgi:hypothetical protein